MRYPRTRTRVRCQKQMAVRAFWSGRRPRARRACGSRLVGTYTDPKHPGCERRVAQIAGTRFASIRGVDEDGVPWVAGASIACADYNGVGKEQLIVGLRVEINLSSSRICGYSMAWRRPTSTIRSSSAPARTTG